METSRRRGRPKGAAAVVAALALAACGGGSSSPGSGSDAGGEPQAGAEGETQIQTTSVEGLGEVLGDERGYTLYHLTTEKSTIKCVDGCAEAWPPLLVPDGGAPAGDQSLPGALGTIERPDGGLQVTYDGLPLYTFAGDSKPGVATGQGVEDVWFAVTPTGSSQEATTEQGGQPTPDEGGGGRYDY